MKPDPKSLRKVLRFENETGFLFWKERSLDMCADEADQRRFNTRHAGKEAFKTPMNGYRVGFVFGEQYRAHAVIWAMHHDFWPNEIDHINGDKADNRLSNLRNVSRALNARNTKRKKNNTSGATGVRFDSSALRRSWRAEMKIDYRTVYIGRFATKEEAAVARRLAAREHGFTGRHGT